MQCTFNLRDAYDKRGSSTHKRIWAADRLRRDEKWGKVFWVGSCAAAFEFCRDQKKPEFYELIESPAPCAFYLDVEVTKGVGPLDATLLNDQLERLGVKSGDIGFYADEYTNVFNSSITEREMEFGLLFVTKHVVHFINASLGLKIDLNDLVVLSGCREGKFSLHIVCHKVVFDSNIISLATFVFELARHMRQKIVDTYIKAMAYIGQCSPIRSFFVRSLMLNRESHGWGYGLLINNTPIDESVYTQNRQFRCAGCGKQGKPILRVVQLVETNLKNNTQMEIMCRKDMDFLDTVPTLEAFVATLVQPPSIYGATPLVVPPSPWFSKKAFDISVVEIFRTFDYFKQNKDCFLPNMRYQCTSIEEQIARKPHTRQTSKLMGRVRSPQETHGHQLIDDTFMVIDEFYQKKQFRKCAKGEVIFHDKCEVKNGQPQGEPSARVFLTDDGELALYCFGCMTLCWTLTSYDPMKLEFYPSEIIDTPYNFINYNGRADIDFDNGHCKFCVVDAPPGTGKTQLIDEYINIRHPKTSVLAITFRIALAEYMSQRLSLTCYTSKLWDSSDPNSGRRLAICLDSLGRIQHTTYDIILLDEGGMTRRHFTSSTMEARLATVYGRLDRILGEAGKVIIAQHELSERDVAFFTSQIGIDANDRSRVRRWCLNRPVPIYQISQSTDFGVVAASMVEFYTFSWDKYKERLAVPFIVFCSSASMCSMLTSLLQHIAPTAGKNAIKGVWSEVQHQPWQQQFIKDPNSCGHEADVVLVTSVLQAGHSIDSHFRCAFWFLFRGILTHQDELQFVQRLRSVGRPDLSMSFAYIEKGQTNSDMCCYLKSLSAHNVTHNALGVPNIVSPLQASTIAYEMALRSDSKNRHFKLWEMLYRRTQVVFDPIVNERIYTSQWSPKACVQWIHMYSSKQCKTVLKFLQQAPDNMAADVDSIKKLLNDNVHYELGEELAHTIAAVQKQLLRDCKEGNSTALLKVLEENDMTPGHVKLLSVKLRTFAMYLDYLAFKYAPNETQKARWLFRLDICKRTPSSVDDILCVFLAAELSLFLCSFHFPIGYKIIQPRRDLIKAFFSKKVDDYEKMTIADVFKRLFKVVPGKFYKCQSTKAVTYYSMARLLRWTLARFRLKLKQVKSGKRKRTCQPPVAAHDIPADAPFIPLVDSTWVAEISTATGYVIQQATVITVDDDEGLPGTGLPSMDLPITDTETEMTMDENIKPTAMFELDEDYLVRSLIALRCTTDSKDFGTWMSIPFLSPFLQKALDAYVLLQPGSRV